MSAHHEALALTDEQTQIDTVRTAFGVWCDVLYALRDATYQLRAIGEMRQAEAMRIDAESMERRARLHLNNMTARERARVAGASETLQACMSAEPANDNSEGV